MDSSVITSLVIFGLSWLLALLFSACMCVLCEIVCVCVSGRCTSALVSIICRESVCVCQHTKHWITQLFSSHTNEHTHALTLSLSLSLACLAVVYHHNPQTALVSTVNWLLEESSYILAPYRPYRERGLLAAPREER